MKVAIPHGAYLIHFGIEGKLEGNTIVEIGGIADANKLKKQIADGIMAKSDEKSQKILFPVKDQLIIRGIFKIGEVVSE